MIKKLGAEYRNQRLKLGLSLQEMSELSGVNISNLSKFENGLINMGINGVFHLSKFYKIKIMIKSE